MSVCLTSYPLYTTNEFVDLLLGCSCCRNIFLSGDHHDITKTDETKNGAITD